jgi:diaminopimelate epimerase
MNLIFFKYHGTGNDFILIDNRENEISIGVETINFLCDRHFGIGADGLMLLEKADGFDFRMKYYNSDGNEGTMCGNGGRCIVRFAESLGIVKNKAKFIAVDGEHFANITKDTVSLKMQNLSEFNIIDTDYLLDTGSPHYVKFVDDINKVDVFSEGKELRYSKKVGEGGANINFAEINGDLLKVGTYERGVENETLSCGTGVTAVAISAYLKTNKKTNNFDIETKGGILNVKFNEENGLFSDIWLTGPAQFVFKGEIKI